jgi:hypothetical protein
MRAERDSAPSQKPLTVAPGSKGGLVQLGETTPRVTVATTNHTSDRASSFVASSSKSISPLIRIQPDGPIWSSITSAPAASNGTQVRIFDLGLSSAPPAPSGKSARVLPGSKSATVFAPEEVQSLIRATNWLAPAAPAAKKTNSVAKPKSQP